MMSMRFLAETEWEILCSLVGEGFVGGQRGVLCGEGLVVHEEEVDVTGCGSLVVVLWMSVGRVRTVVDDESLVAGRHEVTGLLVGSVTDLIAILSAMVLTLATPLWSLFDANSLPPSCALQWEAYLGHSGLALETPSDAVVNTLGLPP